MSDAETELDRLSDKVDELHRQEAELQTQVDALQGAVDEIAVDRFVSSGAGSLALLEGPEASTDQSMSDEFASSITSTSTDTLDRYSRAQSDLEDVQAEVADNQAALERQRAAFEQAQQAAEAQVVHLQQVEAQRLEDERVRRILEAQRAEEARQAQAAADAAAAAAAAAAATTPPPPSGGAAGRADSSGGATATPAAPRPAAPAPTANGGGSNGGGSNGGGSTTGRRVDDWRRVDERRWVEQWRWVEQRIGFRQRWRRHQHRRRPPARLRPRGRRWSARSRARRPTATPTARPRSGGRSHEGVDMLGSMGTPLVAVVSGSVLFKQTPLGGNSVWLSGSDGNRYFYAHLRGFAGSSRSVSQGEVIGYMGATGNANGTVHLHFEVHPGGGASVDPTGYVRRAGC